MRVALTSDKQIFLRGFDAFIPKKNKKDKLNVCGVTFTKPHCILSSDFFFHHFTVPSFLFRDVCLFIMYIIFAIICLRLLNAASASCYNIHNALISNSDYQPCNNAVGSVSMCCGTNRGSKSAATPDTCLQNGLCQNIATDQRSGNPSTSYWREGCSDKTWNSPYCLKGICTSVSQRP